MARQVNREEYAARRRDILDAALQLMHDKGYAQMTVDDVLTRLQISKGAFYHYFPSKRALLEGIVEQMRDSATHQLRSVVDDPQLGAIDKFRGYFQTSGSWKSHHEVAVTTVMRLWRDENNALLRQKLSQESLQHTAPLLEQIIRQGCTEGVFDTAHPHEAAVIITGMGLHLADTFIDAMQTDGGSGVDPVGPAIERATAAYVDALERILGASAGALLAGRPLIRPV